MLFDVTEQDLEIQDEALFYALRNGKIISKSVLTGITYIEFQPFLTGVVHYILTHRPDSILGQDTLDAWGIRDECVGMVWTLMATVCQTDIAVYQSEEIRIQSEITKLIGEEMKAKEDMERLRDEISQLNRQTVNTTAAKNSINALIKSFGFHGFSLREKPGAQYVY